MLKFVVLASLIAFVCAFQIQRNYIDERIVGGEDAEITSYPHQVSLQKNGEHSCGGTIIGNKWIVTSARCTDGEVPEDLMVRAGIRDLGKKGQLVKVSKVHQHPEYFAKIFDYDISILELNKRLKLGRKVQTIPMVDEGFEPVAKSNVTVTGWGSLYENGPKPTVLQKVDIQIIVRGICQKNYGLNPITYRMFCAGLPWGGKDFCTGDTGGPLIGDGKLVGIASWKIGCGVPEFSGVYASIGNLRGFIKEVTGI